jgi:hypothetical protein
MTNERTKDFEKLVAYAGPIYQLFKGSRRDSSLLLVMAGIIQLSQKYLTWLGEQMEGVHMDNDITHATEERLDAVEARVTSLEARVAALEAAGGGTDAEAQATEEEGEEATGSKRRGRKETTTEEIINPFSEGAVS